MTGWSGSDRLYTAKMVADGAEAGLIHRSVLDRVTEIGGRLGCRATAALGALPASLTGQALRRLRRDLDELIAFADAVRYSGWVLGDLAAAPGDEPVPVLDTAAGRLWVSPVHGFELHESGGVRRITELAGTPGTAERAGLPLLLTPLAEVTARARLLEVRDL